MEITKNEEVEKISEPHTAETQEVDDDYYSFCPFFEPLGM